MNQKEEKQEKEEEKEEKEEEIEEDLEDDDIESNYCDPPQGFVRIRPSQFNLIPGTIFVEYPPELGLIRNDISRLEKLGKRKLHYTCYWGRNCVKNAFRRAGFINSSHNWTATWSKHQSPEVMSSLNCLQKVNHFPGSWCIGRKDRLMRTIQSMKRNHAEAYSFHPDGFVFPGDADHFERAIKGITSKKSTLWIMKPVASSCGRGIKVITTEKALTIAKTKKKVLIQRYLSDPYLINGKKFDLRIYVLVTGVDPLRIYIHREGLTRISTDDYSLNNTKNKFAHLTNYSVNKKAPHFVTSSEINLTQILSSLPSTSTSPEASNSNSSPTSNTNNNTTSTSTSSEQTSSEIEGFKWSLTAFRQWLSNREGSEKCTSVFQQIDDVIIKTILAAEPELTHSIYTVANYRTNCSELFGFDIFLDKTLTPHLIEVNISPSLMGSSPLDRRIKGTLLADYCHVTGFYPHDPALLSLYSSPSSVTSCTTTASVSNNTSSSGNSSNGQSVNPFSLLSLSKDMGQQERWRKDPLVENVDIAAITGDSCWMLLCMCEDEFQRAESSFFRLVHPTIDSIQRQMIYYKQPRFSDHLLAKFVLEGMSKGKKIARYFPSRFIVLKSPKSKSKNETQDFSENNLTTPSNPIHLGSLLKNSSPIVSPTSRKSIRSRSMERTKKETQVSQSILYPDLPYENKNNGNRTLTTIPKGTIRTVSISDRIQIVEGRDSNSRSSNRRCTSAPRTREKKYIDQNYDEKNVSEIDGHVDPKNSMSNKSEKVSEDRSIRSRQTVTRDSIDLNEYSTSRITPNSMKMKTIISIQNTSFPYPQNNKDSKDDNINNNNNNTGNTKLIPKYPTVQKYLPIGSLRRGSIKLSSSSVPPSQMDQSTIKVQSSHETLNRLQSKPPLYGTNSSILPSPPSQSISQQLNPEVLQSDRSQFNQPNTFSLSSQQQQQQQQVSNSPNRHGYRILSYGSRDNSTSLLNNFQETVIDTSNSTIHEQSLQQDTSIVSRRISSSRPLSASSRVITYR